MNPPILTIHCVLVSCALSSAASCGLPYEGRPRDGGANIEPIDARVVPEEDAMRAPETCAEARPTAAWSRWSVGDTTQKTVQPSSRGYSALAWSDVGGALLFGGGSLKSGLLGDAWLFDGQSERWILQAQAPSARGGHALTATASGFGLNDNAFLLFGGEAEALFGDTWLFENGGWRELCGAGTDTQKCECGPCARARHAVAYDRNRGQVVLFGGRTDQNVSNETWILSKDLRWVQRCRAACDGGVGCCTGPPGRLEHALAYDPLSRGVVMFGGKRADGQLLSDTWLWDGERWSERYPVHHPSARSGHAMTTSTHVPGVLLFGGLENGVPAAQTLWHWDGSDWISISTRGDAPTPRAYTTLTTDLVRRRAILFGGGAAGDYGDTWFLEVTRHVQEKECDLDAGIDVSESDGG